MEYIDELRALTVRVENGSGVLVRPLCETYDYVLTAEHVIKHIDSSCVAQITISFLCGEIKVDVVDVKRNTECDAAVILIRKLSKDFHFAYPKESLPSEEKRWHLGYPNNQNNKGEAKSCVEHEIRNWLGNYDGTFVKYQCQQAIEKHEIEGMSGGGVFDSHYHLLGVHCKDAAEKDVEQLGKYVMIPWISFKQIIGDNSLPPVLPYDLSTFNTFKEQIFCFDDNMGAKIKLKSLLAQFSILKDSIANWSPIDCYEAFQSYRQARLYTNAEEMEYNDWVLFGEFLVAIKVILAEVTVNKVYDIFPYFQYVQSNKDFDIFDVDNHLDPNILGKVANNDVVFVIGGIREKGYKQDVRPKSILRINKAIESNGEFDIAKLGKDVFGAFTFINGKLFKEALMENTDEIESSDDCEVLYRQLISERIWSKKKNTVGKA